MSALDISHIAKGLSDCSVTTHKRTIIEFNGKKSHIGLQFTLCKQIAFSDLNIILVAATVNLTQEAIVAFYK